MYTMAMQNLSYIKTYISFRVYLSFSNFLSYRSRDFKQNKLTFIFTERFMLGPRTPGTLTLGYTNKSLPFGKGAIALLWHYH